MTWRFTAGKNIFDVSGQTNGDFVRFSDRYDLLWRIPQRLGSGWIPHRLCLCSRNVRCGKHWEWHQEHTKIVYKTKSKSSCITYTIHFLIKVSVSLLDHSASVDSNWLSRLSLNLTFLLFKVRISYVCGSLVIVIENFGNTFFACFDHLVSAVTRDNVYRMNK